MFAHCDLAHGYWKCLLYSCRTSLTVIIWAKNSTEYIPKSPHHDIRPMAEEEQLVQNAPLSAHAPNALSDQTCCSIISPELAKVAFAFGKFLHTLPECYASVACKFVYQNLLDARDILNRHGKLKGPCCSVLLSHLMVDHMEVPISSPWTQNFSKNLATNHPKKGWTPEQAFISSIYLNFCFCCVNQETKKGRTVVGLFTGSYIRCNSWIVTG